jgi:hypothetical protein
MRRPASTGEGNDKIGFALAQHLFVADRAGSTAKAFPIGGILHVRDAARIGPLAAQAVRAAGVALDYEAEMELRMQAVERRVDESGVGKFPAAADQNCQFVLGFNPQRLWIVICWAPSA